MQPILRWAGSKRKLLPLLLQAVPPTTTRYIEPFAGSACLFFALKPSAAVLGDVNPHLIDTYQTIRRHPRLVARAAHAIPPSQDYYYRTRAIAPQSLNPVDRAARFLYLNRNCFNGVYRTNRSDAFNVPMGTKTGSLPTEPTLVRCSIALRRATLLSGDFEHTLRTVRAGDFIYLDPPYKLQDRAGYGEYGYGAFTTTDLQRLEPLLTKIHHTNATFVLSYCDTPELGPLRTKWYTYRLSIQRHVAGFARHRHVVPELLLSNRKLYHHALACSAK